VVDERFDLDELVLCNFTKVGAFRQVVADEAIDLFVGAALPGGVGMAEETREADGLGELLVGSIFRTVVQGEGLSGLWREAS